MSISRSDWEKTFNQIRARLAHTVPPVRYPVVGPSVIGVKAGLSLVALSPEPTAPFVFTGRECYNSSGTKIIGTLAIKEVWSSQDEVSAEGGFNGRNNETWRTLISTAKTRNSAVAVSYLFLVGYVDGKSVNWCYIAEQDGGDARDIVDGTKTFLWSSPKTFDAYRLQGSGLVAFTLDTAKNYSVTFFIPNQSPSWSTLEPTAGSGTFSYSLAGENTTNDWSGLTPTGSVKSFGFLVGV